MKIFLTTGLLFASCTLFAQDGKWSARAAETAMKRWPHKLDSATQKVPKWSYDHGVIQKGVEAVWLATGEHKYFEYIQRAADMYVNEDGSIKAYSPEEYNVDNINNGKLLLMLYQVTEKPKYRKAAEHLRNQLLTHPRTSEGGFWHKKIYPYQMWLDGLYMAQPFYAEYAKIFHQDTIFNDITRQFVLSEKHTRDPKTGLLYHGWDESRQQEWANKQTGQSPNFWGRSLGWYGMALVDALDHFPANHPGRKTLIDILNRFAKAVRGAQDKKSSLWYDVPGREKEAGNYLESSAAAMLVYTYAKGARKGYLPAAYWKYAQEGYQAMHKEFIEIDAGGAVHYKKTVNVSGLGGKPYRDGSFKYYMSERVITDDPKGLGAFIKCAAEMELQDDVAEGRGKTVLLDYHFNNEWKKDATGRMVRWHYTWEDRANPGYHVLGEIFRRKGAKTDSLAKAPTAAALSKASIYIIVDPDTEKETEKPNYISATDVNVIKKWVKQGGVLVLLGNDVGNAEFTNFNKLASEFNVRFIEDSKNRVQGDKFEDGLVRTPENSEIFGTPKNLYIKEFSSLSLEAPARPVVDHKGDAVMAVTKFGKGTVFTFGDPWIYNEYLEGRKLPSSFQNYPAAEAWVSWLLKQASKTKKK